MKKKVILPLLFLIASCTSVKITPVESKREKELFPEINSKNKKEVGENLVNVRDAYYYDAINVKNTPKLKLPSKKVETGIYTLTNWIEEYNLYFRTEGDEGFAISRRDNTIHYFTQRGKGIMLIDLKDNLDYEKTVTRNIKAPYFYQEFIYIGKIGNNLKFTYREFSDYNMARPAFTQDLDYDLSESKTIGCKGLRLEILHASNTEIEYKLIKYFD